MSDLLEEVTRQLRCEGCPVEGLEIDDRHPQAQDPTDVVCVGGWFESRIYRRFYPKLFKWRVGGMRYGVLLRPKIIGSGPQAQEDVQDMVNRLIVAIKQNFPNCAAA